MKHLTKRIWSVLAVIALLAALLPVGALPAKAVDAADVIPQLHYGNYDTLSMIYNQGDCFSMQGMTLDTAYTYCAKVNTDTDASACIIRTSKSTGAKTVMINSATGGYYFSNLGHANALDTTWINGCGQLLVTAGATLVRLTMSGSYLTTAGTYTATLNGARASMTAVQIMSASDDHIDVLVKTGRTLYTGTLDPTASSGNIELTKLCTINVSSARLKGATYDFSSFLQQGMDYHDGKLFLPLSGDAQEDTSVVLVYDLEGADGELMNDPTLSFRIISASYSALFEIEDVAICQETGRLYFNTNRRVTDYDTDYDSCSYFLYYAYDPSMSATAPANYRWETVNNELVSTTNGGNTFNTATQFHGTFSNNVMTHGLFNLSRSVILEHDAPWVVEWKSSGTFFGGALLFSEGKHSKVPNSSYLFRHKESNLIALGYYDGSQHNNYGLKLSDYGIDGTAEHVYRLTNKVSGSTNMVYLSVDGRELGALNNYYIGSTAQGTTSNWLSGEDFTFSYIGAYNHPLTDCTLHYLQVWANGVTIDSPDTFRWESTGNKLTAVSGSDYTTNIATIYKGSVSGTTYSSAAFRLDGPVVLRHDRTWSVEWKSQGAITGGTFLLSAAEGGKTKNAPFLFCYGNDLVALGYRNDSTHFNCGLKLSDYGIDGTALHTYRLTNQVSSDGSNMVYLYVDNAKIGPMNQVFHGLNAQGTTSNRLSGEDLVFDYVGNSCYPMKGSFHYLQIQEDGSSSDVTATALVEFRNYNGNLLSTQYLNYGQMPTPPTVPARPADAKYTYTFTGWNPPVAAVTGDAYYVATFDQTLNYYTVTFQNDDGTVLQSQQVAYGEIPTAPANPTKAGDGNTTYTFTGWDKAITKVTGDQVYTAQYSASAGYYTVIFADEDGTVLSTQYLNYGETPVTPAAPTKASTVSHSYTFVGWDAAIVAATQNTTYTARYASSLRKYTVTFQNSDGTVLSRQLTPYGYAPDTPTTNPTKAADRSCHYTFSGWSPAVGTVTGTTTYTAQYSSVSHSFTAVTVEATCTTTGKTTRTCNICGYAYSTTVAATGHSYVDGTCTACGAADPNYVPAVVTPTLTLKYPTVSFEDVIVMNVYYTAANLDNVVEMGLITYSSNVSRWNVDNAEEVIPGYSYAADKQMYVSSTKGIAAKCLGDTMYFAVYAKLTDGTYTYTKLVSYSPETYAYSQLSTGSADIKPLVVAMLKYGAAAQVFFNHNTGSLVDRKLTSAQLAMIGSYRADMMSAVASPSQAKQGVFVKNGGYANRYPTVSFEGAFSINYYCTPSYAPASGITMYYWNQADYDAASVLAAANATGTIKMEGSGTGRYQAAVENIAAKDLDKGIYVAFVYRNGTTTWTSGVLAYSIGAYCTANASGTTDVADLAAATAVYGYHAKQTFYKTV